MYSSSSSSASYPLATNGNGNNNTGEDIQHQHLQLLQAAHKRRLAAYCVVELLVTFSLFVCLAGGLRSARSWKALALFITEWIRAPLFAFTGRLSIWEAVKAPFSGPTHSWDWIALGLAYAAKAVIMASRYRCTFGTRQGNSFAVLVAGHAVGGILLSVAILSKAGGPGGDGFFNACELRHHCTAVLLAGVLSALGDAILVFFQRGYESARGLGKFHHPSSLATEYSVLSRGYDQGLFDIGHFLQAPASSSFSASVVDTRSPASWMPRYARMLIPSLPPPPHDVPAFVAPHAPLWVRRLARGARSIQCKSPFLISCLLFLDLECNLEPLFTHPHTPK